MLGYENLFCFLTKFVFIGDTIGTNNMTYVNLN